MPDTIANIQEIRVSFVRAALQRLVSRLGAEDYESLADAATSLSRYLDWYKDDFDPELRDELASGIQVLTAATNELIHAYSVESPGLDVRSHRLQLVYRGPPNVRDSGAASAGNDILL